jgi:hypothetical protein
MLYSAMLERQDCACVRCLGVTRRVDEQSRVGERTEHAQIAKSTPKVGRTFFLPGNIFLRKDINPSSHSPSREEPFLK